MLLVLVGFAICGARLFTLNDTSVVILLFKNSFEMRLSTSVDKIRSSAGVHNTFKLNVCIISKFGGSLSEETAKLLLPFATLAKNRSEPFLEETEKATIFCLAELERRKGGGIVIKQPLEKLAFIAKLCYPFWLVLFNETNLVFDGLGMSSFSLSFPRIQDIEAFVANVERSSSSKQLFMAFLKDNANYFQIVGENEEKVLKGIVADPILRQDFVSYLLEATSFEQHPVELVPISATIDEAHMLSIRQELDGLRKSFESDIQGLNRSMTLLDVKTKNFLKIINIEIREVKDKFNVELEKHRSPVEAKVKDLRDQHDTQVSAVSKRFDKDLLGIQKEKVRQEKVKERLTSRIARSEMEIKTHSTKKDAVGEQKWKEERNRFKRELSNVESEIKKLEKQATAVEDEKSSEIFRIGSESDTKVLEASKELLEIESARDAQIKILEQEKEKMEELTSAIIRQIDTASTNREASIIKLDKLGIPQKWKGHVLIYMPFYLVCFQYDSKRRFTFIPPSIVNNVRLMVKIKGALGQAKIRQLFNTRSEAIPPMLNNFVQLIEDNAVFQRDIIERGARADILKGQSEKESVKAGLDELRAEEWLSEKEHASFVENLPK